MSIRTALEYLSALEQNNNRMWFHDNKEQYQIACKDFEELVSAVMAELCKADASILFVEPKELTFKLQRDTRFSHDKSPYNPSFRAHIGSKGKLPIPVGYFLMIRPGNRSFLGGGLFADMFKDATTMVRGQIAQHGDEWEEIITAVDFAEHFTVQGSALKKVPQGYAPQHPQAEYLKNKSWYLEFPVADDIVEGEGFVRYATDVFMKMRPFNAYLNKALEGFQMPTR